MPVYTFDGRKMKKNSSGLTVGEIDRNNVRAYNGARLGEIDRNGIRDPYGKKVAELVRGVLKDDRGRELITMEEIQGIITGEPGLPLAALWYFLVRK